MIIEGKVLKNKVAFAYGTSYGCMTALTRWEAGEVRNSEEEDSDAKIEDDDSNADNFGSWLS